MILILSMFVIDGCSSDKSETAKNTQQASGTPQKTTTQQSGSVPQPPALPEG